MGTLHALVLIYDIRGFTKASRHLPAVELGAFAKAAHQVVIDAVVHHPPSFMKNLGDGYLLLWECEAQPDAELVRDVADRAMAARAAYEAFVQGHPEGGTHLPQRIGVGLAFGEVSHEDDYYGMALNLASRLEGLARPEGIAMDDAVYRVFTDGRPQRAEGFRRHRVRLKGLGRVRAWVQRPFDWMRAGLRFASWAALLLLPLAYVLAADAGLGVPGDEGIRRFLDGRDWSVLRPAHDMATIRAQASALRARLVKRLDEARTPEGLYGANLARAHPTDIWISSQTAAAIASAPEGMASRDAVAHALRRPFGPAGGMLHRDGTPQGWPVHAGQDFAIAEPLIWTWIALARWHHVHRDAMVERRAQPGESSHVATLGQALEHYRSSHSVGWNMFPGQIDATAHSPYTTTLALTALLDTLEPGAVRVDPMAQPGDKRVWRLAWIRTIVAWLVETYDTASGGWRPSHDPDVPVSFGLTAQALSTILRASKMVDEPLAPSMEAAIRRVVRRLDGIPLDHPVSAGEHTIRFVDHTGRERTQTESINLLWHPWAIELTARWLRHLEATDAPRADRVATRRVLGHLVVDLGDAAYAEATSGWAYRAAELLIGLSAVEPRQSLGDSGG